jgi:hypothetical protein
MATFPNKWKHRWAVCPKIPVHNKFTFYELSKSLLYHAFYLHRFPYREKVSSMIENMSTIIYFKDSLSIVYIFLMFKIHSQTNEHAVTVSQLILIHAIPWHNRWSQCILLLNITLSEFLNTMNIFILLGILKECSYITHGISRTFNFHFSSSKKKIGVRWVNSSASDTNHIVEQMLRLQTAISLKQI